MSASAASDEPAAPATPGIVSNLPGGNIIQLTKTQKRRLAADIRLGRPEARATPRAGVLPVRCLRLDSVRDDFMSDASEANDTRSPSRVHARIGAPVRARIGKGDAAGVETGSELRPHLHGRGGDGLPVAPASHQSRLSRGDRVSRPGGGVPDRQVEGAGRRSRTGDCRGRRGRRSAPGNAKKALTPGLAGGAACRATRLAAGQLNTRSLGLDLSVLETPSEKTVFELKAYEPLMPPPLVT